MIDRSAVGSILTITHLFIPSPATGREENRNCGWTIAINTVCVAALFLGVIFGCALFHGNRSAPAAVAASPQMPAPPADRVLVFFFRHSSYAGGGRIHILKVDNHVVGEITGSNYYRLELWPGTYKLSIYLPPEKFFGQENPPRSISNLVHFTPGDAGSIYGIQYSDGMGGRAFERKRWRRLPVYLSDRLLAASLSARDLAQVSTFMGVRYDGPALNEQPHGRGTLTWPDGTVYRGTFEYGRPTNKARFFFGDGSIFMGLFDNGRPKTPGVLMAPDGHILFAGDFVDERPSGVGLRTVENTPEFCLFDHGRDITKTFGQLARETLDAEDEKQIDAFVNRINHLNMQIRAARQRLMNTRAHESLSADQAAELAGRIQKLELERSRMERTADSDSQKFVEALQKSRYQRELTKIKELKADHQVKVAEERIWCQEEFALNRRPCRCAPLADDFSSWDACEEQIEKKFDPF